MGRPPDRLFGTEAVSHLKIPDPNRNAVALAEPPDDAQTRAGESSANRT